MSIPVRRLALQLTPMLDLMLIVLFSQYLENRERSEIQQQQVEVEKATLRDQARQQQQKFEQQQEEFQRMRQDYDDRFENLLSQHRTAGEVLSRNLNLSQRVISETVRLRENGDAQDAVRLEQAAANLQDELNAAGDDLFRFLLRVDEMQKHVTFWEIHIGETGQASLSDGSSRLGLDFSSPQEFADRLFHASQHFADPRNLVLVLLTWGDASLRFRQQSSAGLPLFLEQLRSEARGTRWFDSSVIGYRPNGSVFADDEEKP